MKLILVSSLVLIANAGAFVPHSRRTPVDVKCSALYMGLLNRFRKKKEVKVKNPISIGSVLPEIDVQPLSDGDDIEAVTIQEVLGEGKSILVGMPGAFTTTCSQVHLPGYVKNAGKFAKVGVTKIAAITTNDKFVNGAWAKDQGIDVEDLENSKVTIVADGDGELVKELGLVEDMGFGVGVRSKRFAIVVEDGVVTHLETDDGMEDCSGTSAENMLAVVSPPVEETELELDGSTIGVLAAGLAVVFFFMSMGGGDGGSTAASTTPAIMPALKKEAVEYTLLQQYR